MGVISFPMTLGDYPLQSCVMADFLVINQPSAFNAVLGKLSLRALKATTSIYHLLMKFPTPNGMGQVHRNQHETRECYNQAIRNASRPRQVNIIDQPPARDPSMTPSTQDRQMKRLPLDPLRI